jgi:hypothetical protein
MLDLQVVSESSVNITSFMLSLCAVSLLLGSSASDWDWLSKVGDVAPGDNLDSQLTKSDSTG